MATEEDIGALENPVSKDIDSVLSEMVTCGRTKTLLSSICCSTIEANQGGRWSKGSPLLVGEVRKMTKVDYSEDEDDFLIVREAEEIDSGEDLNRTDGSGATYA